MTLRQAPSWSLALHVALTASISGLLGSAQTPTPRMEEGREPLADLSAAPAIPGG